MGEWGHEVFENDDAGDWVYDLEEVGADHIAATLAAVADAGDADLDAGTACEGLAAAETVARLLGRPGQKDAYTESLDSWIASHPVSPSPELVRAAPSAVDRVLGEKSELAELWAETDSGSAWRTSVEGLRMRLMPD